MLSVMPLLLVFGIHPAPTPVDPDMSALPAIVATPPPAPPEEDLETEEIPDVPTPEATAIPTETPTVVVVEPAPSPVVETPTPEPTTAPTEVPSPIATATPTPMGALVQPTATPPSVRRDHQRSAKPRRQRSAARHIHRLSHPGIPDRVLNGPVAAGPGHVDRRSSDRTARGSVYTVRPGDCLSVIAARYGRDWRIVARTNHLENPNLIYPGQVLNL